jgi:hypothetical protein
VKALRALLDGIGREAAVEDRALAAASVVAMLTALAMVTSFDSFGERALLYPVAAALLAVPVTAAFGARGRRLLFLAVVTGLTSYVMLVLAVIVVVVVVYGAASILGPRDGDLGAEVAGDGEVDVAAAAEVFELDPLLGLVQALAAGAEEDGRDPGGRDQAGVGPERHADDLRIAGVAADEPGERVVRRQLVRVAGEGDAQLGPELRVVAAGVRQDRLQLALDAGGRFAR